MYVVGHFLEPFIGESLAVRRAHRIIDVPHDAPGGQVVADLVGNCLEGVAQRVER